MFFLCSVCAFHITMSITIKLSSSPPSTTVTCNSSFQTERVHCSAFSDQTEHLHIFVPNLKDIVLISFIIPRNLSVELRYIHQYTRDKWVLATKTWRVLRLRIDGWPLKWMVAPSILNKQLRTTDKGWPSSLGLRRGANNSSPLKRIVLRNRKRVIYAYVRTSTYIEHAYTLSGVCNFLLTLRTVDLEEHPKVQWN
jgi:hypothetical protein